MLTPQHPTSFPSHLNYATRSTIIVEQIVNSNNRTPIPNYSKNSITSSCSKNFPIFPQRRSNTPSHPQLEHIICSNQFSTHRSPNNPHKKRAGLSTDSKKIIYSSYKISNPYATAASCSIRQPLAFSHPLQK